MGTLAAHRELAERIGLGGSERIVRLWSYLCGPDEARLLLAMPGTSEELAARAGLSLDGVQPMLDSLYHRGAVFESAKGGVTRYRMTRDFVQFHDATILWPEAPPDFLDLWQEYMDTEYPAIAEMLGSSGLSAFMRVIPIGKSIEAKSEVLPYEDTLRMIDQAERISVTKCTCRLTAHRCGSPLEVCMQFNRAAEYSIKRGTGREIAREEAVQILDLCEEAGLVHLSDNKAGLGHVICNCCACCCQVLPIVAKTGNKALLAPSRYQAEVDAAGCDGCEVCVARCPMGALAMIATNGGGKMVARVESEKCIGCGVCTTSCPVEVIALKAMRPASFIPAA